MGFISSDIIATIRERTDIVQLASDYVRLIPSGNTYKALCPMHKEKTPSFYVTPGKQIFHCFGCMRGGDVFAFVMEMEKMTFPETVRFLAAKCGVEIPDETDPDSEGRKAVFEMLDKVAHFYSANLLSSSAGETARDYLKGRKISSETSAKFRLGLSLNAWDTVLSRFGKTQEDRSVLERAGLIKSSSTSESEKQYDTFRNRLMIPILDIHGRVAGFGGRVLSADDEPKYLNSQEGETFNKRMMLYNFREALPAIRRLNSTIVVEGYLDVISLAQHGFKNTVATLGTAVTPDQIQMLARNCGTVYFCYDGDTAGQRATLRAISLQKDTPISARVVSFDDPKDDPDSFIKREGIDSFKILLEKAKDIYTFLVDTHTHGLKPPLEISVKEKLIREFKELVPAIHSSIARSEVIRKISKLLDVDPLVLEKEFEGNKAPMQNDGYKRNSRVVSTNLNADILRQEWVLKHLIEHPEELDRVRALIDTDDFSDTGLRNIFEAISFQQEASGDTLRPADILDALDDGELSSRFTGLITSLEDKQTEPFMDCVKGMAKAGIKRKLSTLENRIRDIAANGGEDEIPRLTMQQVELKHKLEML